MAICEVRAGPITQRYLMNKTKHDLAHDYMALLKCWEGMQMRAEKAEAENAELVALLLSADPITWVQDADVDSAADWENAADDVLAKHKEKTG